MAVEITRSCGDCTACCKILPIPEIGKLSNKLCKQCYEGTGCERYSIRPTICREFVCQWLVGFGEDLERPDLINLIPDYNEMEGLGKISILWEVIEGAIDGLHGKKFFTQMMANNIIVWSIYVSGEQRLYVPEGLDLSKEDLYQYAVGNCQVFIVHPTPP